MHTVQAAEARGRQDDLLDEIAAGGDVLLTRDGQPVAQLAAAPPAFDREKAARAAAGLREASKGLTLGGLKLADLIAEGRR